MKAYRLLLALLVLIVSTGMRAQYNPTNPDEPDVPVTPEPQYTLTLVTAPTGLGSPFSLNTTSKHKAGEVITNLRANSVQNFTFESWTEDDAVISTQAVIATYTMPTHDVTLVAHYRFTPGSPDEPDTPTLPVYSTVTTSTNPAAGGTSTGGGRYQVGTAVALKATANQYYKFRDWTKDGVVLSTQPSFTYTVGEDNPHIVANFEADYHPQNPDEPDPYLEPMEPKPLYWLHIAVSPTEGGYTNPKDSVQVREGDKQSLQAQNTPWYTFLRWTDDSGTVVSTNSSISYTMPGHDVWLTAHYSFATPVNPDEPGETTSKLHIYALSQTGRGGQTIYFPVYLENPQPVQFMSVDVQMPDGFTVDAAQAVLTARSTGHELSVSSLGNNTYRLLLRGSIDFTGSNGKVLELPVTLPTETESTTGYVVRLTNGAADGQSIPTRSGYIYVEKQSEEGLYAGFSFDQLCDRVRFTNHSSQNVRSLQWDFGDGTTSTDASPLHVYQLPGTYTVSLTVQGQTDTDVAQQTILVNEATSWRTEGVYYLSPTRQDVRSFSDIDELFSFITRSPIIGDVTISIENGQVFTYLLSDEHQSLLVTLHQLLDSSGHMLTLSGGGTVDFRRTDSSISREAIAPIVALGQYMRIDNDTQLLLWGIPVSVAALYTLNGQTVASGEQTQAENFSAISPQLSYRWTLTTPFEGVPIEGSGALPSFTVDNSTGRTITLTYHVTAIHQDTELIELDYTVTVLPSTIAPDLMTRNITLSHTSLKPNEELTLTWQVVNTGGTDFTGGWRENISLVNAQDTCLLATAYAKETSLATGASIQRSARVTVPEQPGLSGSVTLLIGIIPSSDANEPAKNHQNNGAQSQPLTLAARLTLMLNTQHVTETAGTPQHLRAQLLRSGSRQQNETFRISVEGDSRVSADQMVLIPKGQAGTYLNIYVGNNEEQDRDSVFIITATPEAQASAYISATSRLVVEDDERPPLTLRASKSEVTEGETFQLTVTVAEAVTQPLSISLTAEHPAHFVLPSTLTIPAGQTSATVNVTVVDDDLPGLDISSAFVAYADGFERAEALIMLHDDDMPILELLLTPDKVKENDGPMAIVGTLRRTTKTDSKITVRLSDDSNGGLYLGQTKLELAKGVEEVNFNLGPIDNQQMDGDRIYTLTAAVWISSCSCSASGQAAGAVSAQLQVFDDDGPSLKLAAAHSTVKEGDKTTLTVTRNTPTTEALTILLNSNADNVLNYPHTIIIPVGQISETVEVEAAKNEVENDSQTIVFTAETEGFSSGTCWLMLTDQTLPDAQIIDFEADKIEDVVGGISTLTVVVQNEGSAPLTDATPVNIYRRGSSSPVATLYTQNSLAPSEQESINCTLVLPATVGSYAYYAVVNDDGRVREISTRNNISAERVIDVLPPYKATIQTDKQTYQQGEKVTISGFLEGEKTMLTNAELYIISGDVREKFAITTDSEGLFSFQWQPYSLQMGQFAIGVCYPGEGLRQAMATVNIYGLRRVGSNYVTCDVTQGETYDGTITIENPGVLPLTGVEAEVLEKPEGCDVEVSMLTTIGSQEEVQLHYTINGKLPHHDNQWHPIQLTVQTAEGASLGLTLYYYCRSPKAQLVVSETQINTTMTKGKPRDYILYLTNYGRGSTGAITLELPSWMQSVTGKTLPSLAQNDTATVVLRMQPTDDMQLNVPIEDSFGINCQNGNGVQVDYYITPVSDSKGTLTIETRDEFFYQDGTHLQAAEIVVRNPVTKTLVDQGVTDAGGLRSFNLPEGYYQVSVIADGHDAYQNTVLVSPGIETKKVVNLSIIGVTVDWKVEETEVEDKYEVVSSLNYSTNVPVPVVVLDIPKRVAADSLQAGESLIFYATLTNKGLIRANDVSLLLPSGFNHLSFEALSDYQGLVLSAGESITIPVKVSRLRNAATRQMRVNPIDKDPCVGYPGTLYFWECGNDRKWHRYGVCLQLGSCDSDDPRTWNQEPNPTGDEIKPGGWAIGTSIANQPNLPGTGTSGGYVKSEDSQQKIVEVEDKGCEPCQNDFMGEIAKCIPVLDVFVTKIKEIGNTVAESNKCMHAFYRDDLELKQKLAQCPFTTGLAELMTFSENLWQTMSRIPDSLNSEGFIERLKVTIDEIVKDLTNKMLKELGVDDRSVAELTWESKFALLESRDPEFAKMRKKEDELIERLVTLKKKSDKIVKTSEDLMDADRANVVEVLRCTCELTGAIGSVLQETPVFKNVGKEMEKASKFVNKYKCWFDLANYECEYEGASSRGMAKSSRGTGNEDIDSFIEAMKAYVNEQVAGDVIKEEVFGDSIWMDVPMTQLLPLYLYLTGNTAQNESMWRYVLKPEQVSFEQFDTFVERWNTIFNNNQGALDLEKVRQQMDVIDESEMYLEQSGFGSFEELIQDRYTKMMESPKMSSVCARISLSLPQALQFTRQAFQGTLTVFNGHEETAMRDLKLTLLVSNGNSIATPHEFDIHMEELQGFSGEVSLDGGWTLGAQQTGTATILFTPTKYAALTEPVEWSFGGVLSYIDPFTGKELRRELYPVSLTVTPTPVLDLDYFMQRDVMGDDPLTEGIIEPTIPAEFSLLIQNKGYGDASNVKMTTNQPEIVDNEKGLLIDFELLSSQLNGGEKTLALGQNVATDFGTIEAGKTAYAQWWLTSSLMGHFSEYDVKATHVTSYGNPDLSLIDTVRIHELIHTLSIPNANTPGWLVNDIKDSQDLPDMLYISDGTKETVSLATAIVHKTDNNVYTLTVTSGNEAWNYGSVADPTAGQKLLGSVVRQSDGMEMSLNNFWQTDRTLRDGKDPLIEFRLHFADKIQEATENYLLTFVERPANVTIKLDEDDTTMPTASSGIVNVDVKRTIKANEWSTICLPFAMDDQQVNSAFGVDAQVCDFDGYDVLDNGSTISVKFRTVTSIEANHPYIIKIAKAINEFSVSNVVVIPLEKPIKNFGTKDNPRAMVGNYINGTILKNGTLFLSGGKFYYSVGKTKMQGFRAFFDFDDKLTNFNDIARIIMTIDGLSTTIDEAVHGVIVSEKSNKTYNLSGQRVAMPGKGVYIINGKKMVIK